MKNKWMNKILSGSAAAALVMAQVPALPLLVGSGPAYAQGQGSQRGGSTTHRGGSDSHSGGSDSHAGGSDSGTHGSGVGQRGPGADSDGQGGPRSSSGGSSGGKPVWAQEGIPEVELGRLNVARSPAKILDRQLAEAIATITPSIAAVYGLTAEQFADLMLNSLSTTVKFDSPLTNLAIFKDILADGVTQLTGVTPASKIDLAAIALGTASDKTVPITIDTVVALVTILGVKDQVTDADIASIAAKAEAIRQAILTAHG